VVLDGPLPHGGVGVGQGAELVGVVLEGVGVHRAECHAEVGGVAAEGRVVVALVPGDVQGDRGGQPGVLVDLGGVGDLLFDGAGGPGRGEYPEAGAGVPECP